MSVRRIVFTATALVLAGFLASRLAAGNKVPDLKSSPDPTGVIKTVSTHGPIDLSNPFFLELGSNGRTCASCHDAGDGWSVTPAHLQQRFQISQGLDPIFRPVDGANCPSADVSTVEARTSAYSLLLNKGLIRMALPVPANADFSIVSINDPYNCPETTTSLPALYRRPLPSTNLEFVTAIMWDGREPDLGSQARNATLVHALPAQPPTAAQLAEIVDFETRLFTAQSYDNAAGNLSAQGGRGGPSVLSRQTFFPGTNAAGPGFDPNVFDIYSKWESSNSVDRQAVARGELLFNSRPMNITGVPGFNDLPGQSQVFGTCSTCHNTPNVGSNSLFNMMNIGTDSPKVGLPSYVISCNNTQLVTIDPGRALITGKCADIGKVKVPSMRGLPARAPYFHNGTANTLLDVVNFYDQRFSMLLTPEEKADLVAFLNSL